MNNIQKLVTAALLIAVGVLLPIVFHTVGGRAVGTVLLPIHLPVLIAGALLGWQLGICVAILTPIISFVSTGMPMMVMLPYMIVELICYGVVIALVYQKSKQLIVSILAAQIAGRLIYALMLFITADMLHLQSVSGIGVWGSFVTGLPGVILQLLVIPILVSAVKRERCL